MQIPIKRLPDTIRDRLLAIQADPAQYQCFYKKQGGMGLGITGLVVAALAVLGLLAWAFGDEMPLWAGIVLGLLLGAMTWGSLSSLKRNKNATLKPMVMVNPLYYTKVTLDDVSFHGLWEELRDLKITHHHTNGVYTHTQFEFFFKKSAKETLIISPKARAEELAGLIGSFQQQMKEALANEDFESIAAHDIYHEVRAGEEGKKQRFGSSRKQRRKRMLMTWAMGGAIGAVAGFGLAFVSYASAQSRFLDRCSSVDRCSAYFERYSIKLFTTRAQERLTEQYKRQWKRDKRKAPRLRQMAQITRVEQVTPAQEKEILELYQKGSQKALRGLYQEAIDKYKRISAAADKEARTAMIKMLETARDKGYYRVKMTYKGKTDNVKRDVKLPRKAQGKTVVPMGPSFSPALNASRESMITERINRAFTSIVPQDVLEFPDMPAHRRARARNRYGSLAEKLKMVTKKEKDDGVPELEFKVTYVVFPSGSIYVSRKNPDKLYTGVKFFWLVDMLVKGEKIYTLRKISSPPPTFRVSSYGRRTGKLSIAAGTIYSKMASTAFDNFSKQIVSQFGIPVTSKPTRRRNLHRSSKSGDLNAMRERLRKRLEAIRRRRAGN